MSDTMFMDTSNFDLLRHCEAVITHEEWLEMRGPVMGPFSDEVLSRRDGSWFYIAPNDLRRNNWGDAIELTYLGEKACERVLAETSWPTTADEDRPVAGAVARRLSEVSCALFVQGSDEQTAAWLYHATGRLIGIRPEDKR